MNAQTDEIRERMSRWAAGITLAFFVVEWPAVFFMRRSWRCDDCGIQIVSMGAIALLLAPVAALLFMLARRLRRTWPTRALLALAGIALFFSLTLWAGAAGALLRHMSAYGAAANSFVLAMFMAVYCAAVVGGSWMAAIGVTRLEKEV